MDIDKLTVTGEVFIRSVPMRRNIVLTNTDGKQAVINFDGPVVTFTGDMPVDEAARRFFDAVGHLLKSASR